MCLHITVGKQVYIGLELWKCWLIPRLVIKQQGTLQYFLLRFCINHLCLVLFSSCPLKGCSSKEQIKRWCFHVSVKDEVQAKSRDRDIALQALLKNLLKLNWTHSLGRGINFTLNSHFFGFTGADPKPAHRATWSKAHLRNEETKRRD